MVRRDTPVAPGSVLWPPSVSFEASPTFGTLPKFPCLILLNSIENEADDYSESLIFHTINSTALPLESEHALQLILGQREGYDMTPSKEFAYSPDLHFTRLLRDGILKLPPPVQARLGSRPLTGLRGAVRGVLDVDPTVAKDLTTLKKYSGDLLGALNDIVTRLEPTQPLLCQSEFFIELVARVWKGTPGFALKY
jgi:hypothetical protein